MSWKLYATIGEGSTFSKTENGYERNQIIHIHSAFTQNRENFELNSPEDFNKLVADHPRVSRVMYYLGSYPRRGTSLEKSEKWIKKLFKDQAKINQQNKI